MICKTGISIDINDNNGNTTLHYAAKYGHLDLCKLLIERGCSPVKKNSSQQTPYDVTNSHLIRQFLLPLIFKYENNNNNNNSNSSSQYNFVGSNNSNTSGIDNQSTPNYSQDIGYQPVVPQYSHPTSSSFQPLVQDTISIPPVMNQLPNISRVSPVDIQQPIRKIKAGRYIFFCLF